MLIDCTPCKLTFTDPDVYAKHVVEIHPERLDDVQVIGEGYDGE